MGSGLRPGDGRSPHPGTLAAALSSYRYKQFAQPNTGAAFRPRFEARVCVGKG
jgi:hypothetical protein